MNKKGSRANGLDDYRISNARKSNEKRFPNGCIYILNIQGTDYYKIGVSQNPDRRVRDLESATPFTILLIFCEYYTNVYEIEKYIHDLIKSRYIKSEWFELEFETVYDIMKDLQDKKINKIQNSQIKLF